jgi:CheY-like chemotaxis protein
MSKRILVIDDDEGVRDAFDLALDTTDLQIDLAASGEEGVALAEANRPDLVFLDLRMPGIDGVETLRRLLARYPDLLVHIMTAFHEEFFPALRQAAAEGLSFELSRKPLEMNQIRQLAALVDGPGTIIVD